MTSVPEANFRHLSRLPATLDSGDSIQVFGRVHDSSESRFHINLTQAAGLDTSVDVAFHMDTRFGEGALVRNNLQDGTWGDEERECDGIPFSPGRNFECTITARDSEFKVTVDGRYVCSFGYRVGLDLITHVAIQGDVDIKEVSFHDKQSPSMMKLMAYDSYEPEFLLTTPYDSNIPYGLYPRRVVSIAGRTNDDYEGFAVNLTYAGRTDEDIALHFNPRSGDGCVVRNSMSGGGWQDEERHQDFFPFHPGNAFTITIKVTDDCYKISVNGRHYTDFQHRQTDLHDINLLQVVGDVTLHSISM